MNPFHPASGRGPGRREVGATRGLVLRSLEAWVVIVMLAGSLATPVAAQPTSGASTAPAPPAAAPQASVAPICGGSLTPSADTWLNAGATDAHYGASDQLRVGRTARGEERALLRFDLSGVYTPTATIQHAELQLHLVPGVAAPPPLPMEVHEITQTWSERDTSWLSQPAIAGGLGEITYTPDGTFAHIDVTALVAHWFSEGISTTASLELVPAASASVEWAAYSREATTVDLRPHLDISCGVPPEDAVVDQTASDARQTAGIARLKQAATGVTEVELSHGALTFADLDLTLPAAAGSGPVTRAQWFLRTYSDTLRLQNADQDLQVERYSGDGQHVFFRQLHDGIPVVGAELGVHTAGSRVLGVIGAYVPDINLPSVPRLTARQAEDLAIRALLGDGVSRLGDGNVRLRDNSVVPLLAGDTQLRYLNPRLLGRSDGTTHLVWQVSAMASDHPEYMYVDAFTGKIVATEARMEFEFDLQINNADHDTSDACWHLHPTETWYDEDGVVDDANPDADGQNAYSHMKKVYKFWLNNFGLDSYGGDGDRIDAYVHVGWSWANSNYTPGAWCDMFQFGDGYPAALDVVGHEFTHAVDDFAGGLIYENQSGALDESFADIFGHFQDHNWTLGEDAPGGAIRDLSDPPAKGQPDHMLASKSGDHKGFKALPAGVDPDCDPDTGNDCGYVHHNDGIPNKAAYLVEAGTGTGTFNGRQIVGLGEAKAKLLYYNVLRHGVWGTSKFTDVRNLAVTWAKTFRAAPFNLFTDQDVCDVRNAYAAVGLGSGDADCDGKLDSQTTDNDGDTVPDSSDNCMYTPNPLQSDADGDGIGDACDADADNDGVANDQDNCPLVANANQWNMDGDSKGDVCDDSDNDGIVDSKDNCPTTYNPDQANLDHDSYGDACDNDLDNDGVANSQDNCPTTYNPDQANDDHDAYGNACDLCPTTVGGDNADPDGDGLGNVCDPDDDNDGVPDAQDNCPTVPNANQMDWDKDGVGTACDDDENDWLWDKLNGTILIDNMSRIPLGICTGCGSYIPGGTQTTVNVGMSTGYAAFVVDSNGKAMAHGQALSGGKLSLNFSPATIPQTTAGAAAARRQAGEAVAVSPDTVHYFLDIMAAPGSTATGSYTITIGTSNQAHNAVYLPTVSH